MDLKRARRGPRPSLTIVLVAVIATKVAVSAPWPADAQGVGS